MKWFEVSSECDRIGLHAGAILFENLVIGPPSDALRNEVAAEIQQIQEAFVETSEIRALPEIAAHHEVLRAVGVKPKRYPPSNQKLLELAHKRGTSPSINSLVDSYNLVSLQTWLSLGAHDLDLLELPVTLRLFHGNEKFQPLGSEEEQPVREGEFGYVDSIQRVICRLDSLQADFSKVTERTQRAMLILEWTDAHTEDMVATAYDRAAELVLRYCGGTVTEIIREKE